MTTPTSAYRANSLPRASYSLDAPAGRPGMSATLFLIAALALVPWLCLLATYVVGVVAVLV